MWWEAMCYTGLPKFWLTYRIACVSSCLWLMPLTMHLCLEAWLWLQAVLCNSTVNVTVEWYITYSWWIDGLSRVACWFSACHACWARYAKTPILVTWQVYVNVLQCIIVKCHCHLVQHHLHGICCNSNDMPCFCIGTRGSQAASRLVEQECLFWGVPKDSHHLRRVSERQELRWAGNTAWCWWVLGGRSFPQAWVCGCHQVWL